MKTPRRSFGFTLIELMVTVALVGLIAGLAIAGARQMVPRMRATRTVTDLVAIFRQAPRLAAASNSHLWLGIEDPNFATPPYEYVLVSDWNGNLRPDNTSFDPKNPTVTAEWDDDGGKRKDRIVTHGEIYQAIKYYAGGDVKATTLPEIPTFFVPIVTNTQLGCTTSGHPSGPENCAPSNVNNMAWIHFKPNGEVEVPARKGARFVTLILGRDNADTESEKTIVILSLPYGLAEVFSDA